MREVILEDEEMILVLSALDKLDFNIAKRFGLHEFEKLREKFKWRAK